MVLSTLIVQREIASSREVEEALARQILYGGDFVTNLLEVCRLDEAAFLPIVAESLGLPPAPPGELPRPKPEAHRLVAAEVAVERNLAPLTVDRYGLTVAVAEPLSREVEQELAFALALPVAQKIAPLVRIRQALARDYGEPIDERLQRLLRRMMTDGPRGANSAFPPMRNADLRLGAPRPPSVMPPAPQSTAAFERLIVRRTLNESASPPANAGDLAGLGVADKSLAGTRSREPALQTLAPPDAASLIGGRGITDESPTTAMHAASSAEQRSSSSTPSGPTRRNSRRAKAPSLDFRTVHPPSSLFGSERFALNDNELQLLDASQGKGPEGNAITAETFPSVPAARPEPTNDSRRPNPLTEIF